MTIQESEGSSAQKEQPKVEAPQDAAGKQLTQKQVDAALLKVADLPSGWTLGEPSDDDDDDDEIKPAKCAKLVDSMDADAEDAVAEGERNFNKGGAFGTLMGVSIASYDDEVDTGKLKQIADIFGECSSFKGTDKEGVVTHFTVAPLSLANVGDESLALTLTAKSQGFTFPINLYMVVIGHNALTFYNGGLTGADGSQLEKIGKKAIKRLEKVAK